MKRLLLLVLCALLSGAVLAAGIGAGRAKKLAVDPSVFDKAPTTTLEWFDGQTITVRLHQHQRRSATNDTWYGTVVGQPGSHVVFTIVDGKLVGMFYGVNGKNYRVQDGDLEELDPARFPPEGDSQAPATQTTAAATGDSAAQIDVMIVYSNQTASAAGAGIAAQAQQAIDTANLVYSNSGITTRLRLVRLQQVNHNDSGDFDTDLSWLSSDATVAALRNQYAADLISMFVEMTQYCGYGWIGPGPSNAFTVVNRGCASGNLSFPHEFGHNFGARHDVYVDPTNTPYAYGHGWVDVAEGWRDVMAYNNACSAVGKNCTRIPYFSNPNLSYGNPLHPLGSAATADVTRVHNQNAATVVNYRTASSSALPAPSSLRLVH